MREWTRLQVIRHPLTACGRIDFVQAARQRTCRTGFLQCYYLTSAQERFNGPPQTGPEFDLPGDGSLGVLRSETSIQNQCVGKLHGLTHVETVAKCYPCCKRHSRSFREEGRHGSNRGHTNNCGFLENSVGCGFDLPDCATGVELPHESDLDFASGNDAGVANASGSHRHGRAASTNGF